MPFDAETGPAQGREGGAACRDTHGREYFREMGAKGGRATAARHNRDHYTAIGKKGGERVRELVARAKRLEAEE